MGAAHGEVHWTELMTHDPARAVAFYTRTLGWRIEEVDMGQPEPYRIAWSGDEMVGGIFKMSGPEMEGAPDQWMTYFAVEDADAAVAAIKEAGGEALGPPMDVPTVGRIVMLKDAGGAMCGYIQPAEA